MKDLIKNIHTSDIFGVFIETGAGVPITSNLLSVSGASSTIYMSECPYSKEYFYKTYELDRKHRIISLESLKSVLNSQRFSSLFKNKNINTIFVSSFQVGENNDISTHGWIALKYKDTLKYYHISIHEPLTREKYIKRIGENGIKILFAKNSDIPNDCDVDIVLNEDFSPDYEATIGFISNIENKEQFSIFSKNKIDRLESITRDNEELILFKGSFNPIQNAHYNFMKVCENKYPKAKPFFMISCNTFEKGLQNTKSIVKRLELIFEFGYSVIICNNPFFKDNINFLRNKFDINKKIILLMGMDTVNRLLLDYTDINNLQSDFKNIDFSCVNRNKAKIPNFLKEKTFNNFDFIENLDYSEISSTEIRKLLEENNFQKIKEFVPEKIYKKLVDSFK